MFLRSLKLSRLLSFGPDAEAVELRPLNVLIGPNGSGKSNFIEAIALLKATPKDLARTLREGGGISSFVWQGAPNSSVEFEASIDFGPPSRHNRSQTSARHRLALFEADFRAIVGTEKIEEMPLPGETRAPRVLFDAEYLGSTTLYVDEQARALDHWDCGQSVLSQVRGPDYPALEVLAEFYESIRLYREFTIGRRSPARRPQPADLPTDHLMESAENLGLILNKFRRDIPTKNALIEGLKNIFEGVTDFSVQIEGGTVQIFLEEERWTIPATRLSDGTIRWLALLAILLDPKPPPLVCIEEPELGLHPDLVHVLARLLKEASERMQLVVTTHSEALVDAFRDSPEDVIVCERPAGSTTMRRLDGEKLAEWLEEYGSLSQLWSRGLIGGTRW